jgi:predicted GNAT family N-acyltransferase
VEKRTEVNYHVRVTNWTSDRDALQDLRHEVFVLEQHVPEELEWDGIDPECRHAIAEDLQGNPIGTGRLLPDGHIGRMAVRGEWRGRGVGGAILGCLVNLARELGHSEVVLNAQTRVIPFYERFGFVAFGSEFDDAGIPHRAMRRAL